MFKNTILSMSVIMMLAIAFPTYAVSNIINAPDEAWVNTTTNMAYIFLEGGKFKSFTLNDNTWVTNGDGNYQIKGNSLSLDKYSFLYSIKDNTLTFIINDTPYEYTRTQSFNQNPDNSATHLDKRLILSDSHAWIQDDTTLSGYIFKPDGTYTYYWGSKFVISSEGTWSTNDNTLTYITNDNISKSDAYSISGDTLTITNRFGDSNVYTSKPIPSN